MKNVSIILFNMVVISAALNFSSNSRSSNYEAPKRNPKFYGPLFGALIANLLALPISARLSFDPPKKHSYPSAWDSEHYPILTTAVPQVHHHHFHHDQPSNNQQQIVTIHDHPPTGVIIDESPAATLSPILQSTQLTGFEEPIAAESSRNIKRQRAPNSYRERRVTTYRPKQKRGTQRYYSSKKRYSNSNKRRRYTTTPSYYDSYEDFTTQRPRRKSQPKRPIASSYEEDDSSEYPDEDYDYEESYEFTTRRPYKKRRRTTTRRYNIRYKNKNKKRQDLVDLNEYDDDYEFNYRESIDALNVRPRQETTTTTESSTSTSTDSTTSSTTMQSTQITNGTTAMPNTTTNSTGYGYGPSNGNENISITYGPPTGQNGAYGPPRPSYGPPYYPQYHAQYTDWYDNEASQNAIVQKVHDLIGIDHHFQRRLT